MKVIFFHACLLIQFRVVNLIFIYHILLPRALVTLLYPLMRALFFLLPLSFHSGYLQHAFSRWLSTCVRYTLMTCDLNTGTVIRDSEEGVKFFTLILSMPMSGVLFYIIPNC